MEQKNNFFDRLQKLFSNNVLIKTKSGTKIRNLDIQKLQGKIDLESNIYNKHLSSGYKNSYNNMYEYINVYNQHYTRRELYEDYELMDKYSIIASALDIYAAECLGSKTLIPLLDGSKISIKELYEKDEKDFWVYSLNKELNEFVPSKCEKIVYSGKKEMYKITLKDKTIIECSGKHKWVNDKNKLIKTSELKINDKLKELLETDNHEIINIEKTELQDSYDLVNVGESHVYAIETKSGSKLFCHNSSTKNEYNKVISIQTENEKIKDSLENLFFDILNINFNLRPWVRMLVKYGDLMLKLDILEKIGITNAIPLSPYAVSRVESNGEVKFRYESNLGTGLYQTNKKFFQDYEIIHFRLLSDTNYLPYGKSILENGRQTWKQLLLLKDAMLIQRIMRAPERRIFKIDVANLAPADVDTHMNRIMTTMKKIPFVNSETGEYNLRFNLMPIAHYSKIPLLDGREITIKELANEYDNDKINYVYSIDKDNKCNIVPGKVTWCGLTEKNAQIIRITLDDDSHLDLEPSHPIMLRTGEYIEAKNIKKNDSIMPFYTALTKQKGMMNYEKIYNPKTNKYEITHRIIAENSKVNHKVKKTEYITEKEDVYCMSVEKYHNFAVITHNGEKRDGIFVKNSSLEDIFLPVRGGNSGTEIDTLPGMEFSGLDDIEMLRNELMASLQIPKSFLTYEEGLNSKSNLASEDVRFSRSIEWVQRIVESELKKMAMIHLYTQGFDDDDISDFDLHLTISSKLAEEEKIENWNNKFSLATDALDSKLVSRDWVYTNIFHMSKDEYTEEQEKIIDDLLLRFRYQQIEDEGNDPAKTNETSGTEFDKEEISDAKNRGLDSEDIEAKRKRLNKITYSKSLNDKKISQKDKKMLNKIRKYELLNEDNLLDI